MSGNIEGTVISSSYSSRFECTIPPCHNCAYIGSSSGDFYREIGDCRVSEPSNQWLSTSAVVRSEVHDLTHLLRHSNFFFVELVP